MLINVGRLGALAANRLALSNLFPAFWDFANNTYKLNGADTTLSASTTYSRAGSGWADNITGTWTEFVDNLVRRTNKGVTIEPSSTNFIRNNSNQGAVAGSPGTLPTNWTLTLPAGLTRSITLDTVNGAERINIQIQGTAGDSSGCLFAFEGTTGIAALTGQAWTESCFLSINNNTNVFYAQLNIVERTSGGGFVNQGSGSDILVNMTSSPKRFSYTYNSSGGGTVAAIQPRLAIGINSGQTVNFILSIYWPQMERGSVATTPIRTAGTSLLRNTDPLTLKAPADAYDLRFTFSDNSTQDVVQLMGDYLIPTNLSAPTIKRADATRTDPTKTFRIEGDSIGRGDGGTPFWYDLLSTSYTPSRPYKNTSVSGSNSTTMFSRVLSDTINRDWTWIICDGRPNTGESAATIIQNYKDIISYVVAGGGRIFISPVLPLSPGGGTDPVASVVTAVNSALLSDSAFSGKTMGSTAQANYLSALNDDLKRTNDFIHVNNAGQGLQATHYKTALNALGY